MSIFVVVRDEYARVRELLPLRELKWAHAILGINSDRGSAGGRDNIQHEMYENRALLLGCYNGARD